MSLTASLTQRPAVTNAITVAIILLASAFIAYDLLRVRPTSAGPLLYFTVDDGATWFADAADRMPPYEVKGQTAVRAYVYTCDKGQPFVAYVERYTPDARARLAKQDAPGIPPVDREFIIAEGTEVKRPGAGDWVKRASDAGETILVLKCPEGDSGVPKLAIPGE